MRSSLFLCIYNHIYIRTESFWYHITILWEYLASFCYFWQEVVWANSRAYERGYSDTRHCQKFSSDTRHWGLKMPDTRHSKFTPTLDTQLQKDVIQEKPRSLVAFQKIADSNRTIYFKRPYTKSTLDTVFFKSTSGIVKYLISTLTVPFKGPRKGWKFFLSRKYRNKYWPSYL